MKRSLILVLALGILLAACAPGGGGAGTDAAAVVEQYLTAKIAGDRDAMAPLICAAMEPVLDLEASSFSAVQAVIEGMECAFDQASSTVTCAGEIKAEYGLETRSFPLASYSVVREDGAWRWCGEAAGG